MIVGGRNIADHYFGVHGESNFRDLDTVAVGPVVRDASAVYDDFWNSPFAVPYAAFVKTPPTRAECDAAIAEMRTKMASERLPYPVDEEVDGLTAEMQGVRDALTWAPVRVLYDPPRRPEDTSHRIFSALDALVSNAQQEVLIENAYFVPRDHGVELTAALHARGARVRVLTNSLASNDVLAVHSGYQKYRDDLLENGVEMYELRPDSTMEQLRWSGLSWKSRAGLHAKAMVVDRRYVVVGSYNLDPRSADINTELALLVDSPAFAEMVAEFFDDGVKAGEQLPGHARAGTAQVDDQRRRDGSGVHEGARDQLVDALQSRRAGHPADSFDPVRRVGYGAPRSAAGPSPTRKSAVWARTADGAGRPRRSRVGARRVVEAHHVAGDGRLRNGGRLAL
jgi:putative cardiolipin synthase